MHLLPRLGENRKPDGSQLLVCPQWYFSHFQNFVTMCCVTYKHHHLERQEITLTNMKNVDISMEAGKVLSQRHLALLYAMIPNKARRNGQKCSHAEWKFEKCMGQDLKSLCGGLPCILNLVHEIDVLYLA